VSLVITGTRRSLGSAASASLSEAGCRLIQADVDGYLWIKRASVVAYTGDLRFHLEPVVQAEHVHATSGPIRSAIKRELVPLSKAQGRGRLLLTNDGRFNQLTRLTGETLYVASPSLLAFEPSLSHDLLFLGAAGALAGGVLAVKLSGCGLAAISFAGESITLPVTPDAPLSVDPASLVMWHGDCRPQLKTDFDAGSFVGHGGGQPLQLLFSGSGEVTVQARKHTDLAATLTGFLQKMI
jgi:uncharacterized protein (AIM24 family)